MHRFIIGHVIVVQIFGTNSGIFAEVVGDKGERIVVDEEKMPGAKYFPDAKINYAENLLKYTGDEEAIVFRSEDKLETRLNSQSIA